MNSEKEKFYEDLMKSKSDFHLFNVGVFSAIKPINQIVFTVKFNDVKIGFYSVAGFLFHPAVNQFYFTPDELRDLSKLIDLIEV